jgi:ankyrin repeat protein/actin-like ATPase involved in cell morphogenesis
VKDDQPHIGIDFGTTYSAVSWLNPKSGMPEIIRNEHGDEKTPSVVYHGRDEILIGKPAWEQLHDVGQMKPAEQAHVLGRTLLSVKRLLKNNLPLALPNGEVVAPVELTADILAHLRECAERGCFNGESIKRVSLSHPVIFNKTEKERLKEAAALAGFTECRLIDEPLAAIHGYLASGAKAGDNILVFDMGGGTLDLAFLCKDGEDYHMPIPPMGEETGGDEFDRILYDHFERILEQERGIRFSSNGTCNLGVLAQCRKLKEKLTSAKSARFSHFDSTANIHAAFDVVREELEALFRDQVDRAAKMAIAMREKIKAGGFKLDTVLLVGGSTRMPMVRKRLAEILPVEPIETMHADVAVAMGGCRNHQESFIALPDTLRESRHKNRHNYRRWLRSGYIVEYALRNDIRDYLRSQNRPQLQFIFNNIWKEAINIDSLGHIVGQLCALNYFECVEACIRIEPEVVDIASPSLACHKWLNKPFDEHLAGLRAAEYYPRFMPIYHAVANRSHATLKVLLSNKSNPDGRPTFEYYEEWDEVSPLYLALKSGDIRSALLLIKYGADPYDGWEYRDGFPQNGYSFESAAINAASHKHFRIIAAYLLKHADIHERHLDLLMAYAIEQNESDLVQQLASLRKHTLNPGLSEIHEFWKSPNLSPLGFAVQLNRLRCAEALLAAGAHPVFVRNIHKSSEMRELLRTASLPAIHKAIRDDNVVELQMLCAEPENLSILEPYDSYPALHYAIMLKNERAYRGLIDYGADIRSLGGIAEEWEDEYCHEYPAEITPLHIAARESWLEAVKDLTKRSAPIDPRDFYQRTPLHYAARAGAADCVEHLLKLGAECEPLDIEDYTPLMLAAESGHEKCVQLLVDSQKALHYEKDKRVQGRQCIAQAAPQNSEPVAEMFLSSSNSACDVQTNPLLLAVVGGHTGVVRILLESWEKSHDLVNMGEHVSHLAMWTKHLLDDVSHCSVKSKYEMRQRELIYSAFLPSGFKRRSAVQQLSGDSNVRPVHIAAWRGDDETLKMLIDAGADIDALTCDGWCALSIALCARYAAVAEQLIMAGSYYPPWLSSGLLPEHLQEDIDMPWELNGPADAKRAGEKKRYTSLHVAAIDGWVNAIENIVADGADIDANTTEGYTPLHLAVFSEQWSIVREEYAEVLARCGIVPATDSRSPVERLLALGADIAAKTGNDETAAHIAARYNCCRAMQVLADAGADLEVQTKDGYTALHLAVINGHREVSEILLDAGADINARDGSQYMPLHRAVECDQADIPEILLLRGVDVEAKTDDGETALQYAVRCDGVNAFTKLVEYGADMQVTTGSGEALLHLAAQSNRTKITKMLIEAGADLEARTEDGCTPLHWAVMNGHGEVVELLLDAGADINAQDQEGYTPLHLAIMRLEEATKSFPAQCEYIKMRQLMLRKPSNLVAGCVVEIIIARDADVDVTTKLGETTLHYAARRNLPEMVKTLVDAGADIEAQSNSGYTPLHWAAQEGHKDIIVMLIELGANLLARNTEGLTPAELAAANHKLSEYESATHWHENAMPTEQ